MTRNIDYRVEAFCPVRDVDAQIMLQAVLDQQWNDNVKARTLDAAQTNKLPTNERKAAAIRSQETIHRYLATGKLPRMPKSNMRQKSVRRRKGH
jgi:polyphosphate kinase